jgi:hypothetical protein
MAFALWLRRVSHQLIVSIWLVNIAELARERFETAKPQCLGISCQPNCMTSTTSHLEAAGHSALVRTANGSALIALTRSRAMPRNAPDAATFMCVPRLLGVELALHVKDAEH